MIRDGADPASMVAVTFTNAAADELKERLGVKLGFVGTLHAWMLSLLQRVKGAPITVISEEQTGDLIEEAIQQMSYKGARKVVLEAIKAGPYCKGLRSDPDLVARRFWTLVTQSGTLTFDAILHYGARLMVDPSKVLPYAYLFCDEYQDASDLDDQIYRLFHGQKFFVGDADQNVFAWRGSNVGHIVRLAKEAEVHVLEDNFRSNAEICEAADNLIEHNKQRIAKTMLSVRGDGGDVLRLNYESHQEELAGVAQGIRRIQETHEDWSIAVLVRNRKDGSVETWTLGLESYGIAVQTTEKVEAPNDWSGVIALLGFLNNPASDQSAYWLLSAQRGAVAARKLKLEAAAAGRSINDYALHLPGPMPLGAIWEALGKFEATAESIRIVRENSEHLGEDATIADLLLRLRDVQWAKKEAGEGVVVTTYHSAKGREWDAVFLPAFEQSIIPGARKDLDIEAERRLAYVGITRAKTCLRISFCHSRVPKWGARVAQPSQPSQFIAEAGL